MKSDKGETMMTAKLINVEGSKIKIELTLELSRWLSPCLCVMLRVKAS
jgi:hypothetical protein